MRFLAAFLLLALTCEGAVKAQTIKPPDDVKTINPKAEIVSSSEKIVRGAPFSAEAISESVQILFDGNRIVKSSKARLYRDGEGRFRRDELPKPVGIGSFVDMPKMIFILDPVEGVKFYLYPDSKTVRRLEFKTDKSEWDIAKAEQEITRVEQEIRRAEQDYENALQEFEKRRRQPGYQDNDKDQQQLSRLKQHLETRKSTLKLLQEQFKKQKWSIEKPPPDAAKPEPKSEKRITKESESSSESSSSSTSSVTENEKPAKVESETKTVKKAVKSKPPVISTNPIEPKNPALPALPFGDVKTELLGTKNLEGVEAEGTRLTTTVAAGFIGNERPIEIVYERWYSKELKLIVYSKYADPRFGEQTYRLTNIRRSEPDSALFTPPADYQILTEPDKRIKVPKVPRVTEPRKKPAQT